MKIWRKLLLIYVLLLVGIGWFFMMSFEHFKENALTLRTTTQQAEYASVLQSNRILADTFFNEVLNREEVLAIVQKIVHSDGDERRTQRGLLYRSLAATYQRSKKNVGSILHFHFPDNRSMLRFPKPQLADDDLTEIRPSIARVNKTLHAVYGYESARFAHGYRHVYPLIYHGEHIGSVEVSQLCHEIYHKLQQLEAASKARFVAFHRKTGLFNKLFKGQEQYHVSGELHQELVRHKYIPEIFGEIEGFPDYLVPLLEKLKNNEQTQIKIPLGRDFSQYVNLNRNTYSIVFHPLKNISGQYEGYLLGITPEPQIDSLINKFWIYYLGTAFILLWIFVYRGLLHTSLQQKKKLQQTLQSLFDNKLVGMVEVDLDGNYLQVNRRWEEMTGYSQAELLEKTFRDLTHPEDLERQLLLDKHIKNQDKQAYGVKKRYIRKDGSVFWGDLSTTGLYDTRDQVVGMVGIITDITARKLAEEALRIERDNLNNIFEAMSDGVIIINQDHDIEYANPVLQKEFGLYEGKKCYEYFHNKKEVCPWCKNAEVFAGKIVQWEWYSDKNQKTYELMDSPLKDHDGSILMLGIFRDITERKQAKDELQQAHDNLEQQVIERTETLKKTYDQLRHAEKLSVVGRFSASIAHEFNNPLCGVVNVINGISNRTQLSENDQKLANMALQECERMKNLVTDLQQFNKPSNDKRVAMNIEQTIDEILLFTKKDLKKKKAQVTKAIPDDLPEIWAISDQIKQVLINLIGNASDALGSDGGTISIAATSSGKNNITLSIADTGEGIDPASLEHIFEPFYTTKAIKGTGLGLSVSHGIIMSHGGEIDVKSELGKGTTFTLTLPCRKEARR